MTPPRKSLLCRTRLRHHWELDKTSDGNTHIRRANCLKERWTGARQRSINGGGRHQQLR